MPAPLRRLALWIFLIAWPGELSLSAESLRTISGTFPLRERESLQALALSVKEFELPYLPAGSGARDVLWFSPGEGGGSIEIEGRFGPVTKVFWPATGSRGARMGVLLPTGTRPSVLRLRSAPGQLLRPPFGFELARFSQDPSHDGLSLVFAPGPPGRMWAFWPPFPRSDQRVLIQVSYLFQPSDPEPSTRGRTGELFLDGADGVDSEGGPCVFSSASGAFWIYPAQDRKQVLRLSFPLSGTGFVTGFRASSVKPESPLPLDLGTLIDRGGVLARDREREWFRWAQVPQVLILQTNSYAEQDRYFLRLAYFVEKAGFRGRLLTDEELAGRHGWNAHDYRPEDLAAFFNRARAESFPLSGQEEELLERLVRERLLHPVPGGYEPGQGAVLGISLQSPPALRRMLLTHEASHGLFFTRPRFREAAMRVWQELAEGEKTLWRSFMAQADYDPSWDYLMANEFQAYALQQEAGLWPAFLKDRVWNRSLSRFPQLAELLESRFSLTAGRSDGLVRAWREIESALSLEGPWEAGRLHQRLGK